MISLITICTHAKLLQIIVHILYAVYCIPMTYLLYNNNTGGLYSFFKIFIYLFYLFMAALGLRFCARAFSSCGKRGPLFIAVRGPFTVAASLVAGHRLQTHRLSNCGSRAQPLHGMWDLPRPGLEPMSPALAGRLSTTVPPGKPWRFVLLIPFTYPPPTPSSF